MSKTNFRMRVINENFKEMCLESIDIITEISIKYFDLITDSLFLNSDSYFSNVENEIK